MNNHAHLICMYVFSKYISVDLHYRTMKIKLLQSLLLIKGTNHTFFLFLINFCAPFTGNCNVIVSFSSF